MSHQRHVIKRQIIDLEIEESRQAPLLQAEVSRIYRQQIAPLIDRACTDASAPDVIHRIDLLELDLGYLDPGDLETAFVAGMQVALAKALAEKIRVQEQITRQAGTTTVSQSYLDLFLFFMETGSLPWWAERGQRDVLEMAVSHLLHQSTRLLQTTLEKEVSNPRFLKRLVAQFEDSLLLELLRLLLPVEEDVIIKAARELIRVVTQTSIAKNKSRATIRQELWQTLFHAVLVWQQSPQLHLARLFAIISAELTRQFTSLPEAWAAALAPLIASGHLESIRPSKLRGDARQKHELKDSKKDVFDRTKPRIQQGEAVTLPIKARDEPAAYFSESQETYVDNAGLVLLWPFLPPFFDRLSLTTNKLFVNPLAQQRAVGLLQLLASGDTVFPEYQLPLNKVLCGLDVADVYELEEPLGESDVAACEDLLTAVIQQVPILNNMSISGFRGSFLLRQAVLRSRDGAWLLQIEQETYDVVLDHFPWHWEWIKLPWMSVPMRVEW